MIRLFSLDHLLKAPPFSVQQSEKEELFKSIAAQLTDHHRQNCMEYSKILEKLNSNESNFNTIENIPFIPVRLFKEFELLSTERSEVIKTLTSSGTSGQQVSKIFLDRSNAALQTKVLTKIMTSFLGNKRLPMLIIDSKSVIKDRRLFSARGAGILGFSLFGHDLTYALDENMNLDLETIQRFLDKHKGQDILLFGFTSIIWEHFYKSLRSQNLKLDIENGLLIHGGGWKKLIEQSVSNEQYKNHLQEVCGIKKVSNYYGMVEQTGSIFVECEYGHLHCSIFSDILIRDHTNFKSLGFGETGLIQLLSLLPSSYPGHSILSEDLGELLGQDDCKCGKKGKYFRVHGRVKNAEIRGCSDTYAQSK